jgi:hypothetical protein
MASFLGPFDHTTGATWGGSQLSPSVLKALAVLGGFIGLDHLALRSPKTALLKFLVNCISLGFWYFYDIVQVFADTDFIRKYGYSIPGLGPVGLGAGMLHQEIPVGKAPPTSPSPFLFVAYSLLIAIPFGISHFIAGDYYGGAMKFFLSYVIFTFLLGWIWAAYSTFYLVFNTKDLLEKGTDRMFPATLFMDSHGPAPSLLIPKTEGDSSEEDKASSFFSWIFGCLGFMKPLEKPVLEGIVSAGTTLTGVAAVAKDAAIQIEKTDTAPAVAEVLQKGGAAVLGISSTPIFLGVSALLLVGAVGLTLLRVKGAKQKDSIETKTRDDLPPEVSDEPPSGSRAL